jgi:hypothetical protein
MNKAVSYQQGPQLPTEFALVVACCRWTYSGEGDDDIRCLAGAVDWGEFLRACRRHRVQGLAWHALSRLQVALPAPVRILLGEDAGAVAEQGLRAAQASASLADAFAAAGVPLMFLKGLTLGKLAYGNPFLKMGSDIDILVAPADVGTAAALLGTLGYRLEVPGDATLLLRWHGSRKESVWRGDTGPIIELHGRVADQPELLSTISAASPSQRVSVVPGVELSTFADDELFAYLCVHGASSAWFRLKWITDLAAWLHGRSPAEIEKLFVRAGALGAGRAPAQALLLAYWLYGIPLAPTLRGRLGARTDSWLAKAALREMLRDEPTQRLLGTRAIHLTQFLLIDGLRYKWAELKRQARAAAGLL